MMGMYFHSSEWEQILFREWRTHNWMEMIFSMIGIVLIGVIYEGLKNYREQLFITAMKFTQVDNEKKTRWEAMLSKNHVYQTILHMIQFIVGYFLMLIFMTYNVWLAIATVGGIGLGYWIFAWNKYKMPDDDCCM